MGTKSEDPSYSKLKQLFITDFLDFGDGFEVLMLNVDFADMLMEYSICNGLLERIEENHNMSHLYIQLKKELQDEIKNYIIRQIKSALNAG